MLKFQDLKYIILGIIEKLDIFVFLLTCISKIFKNRQMASLKYQLGINCSQKEWDSLDNSASCCKTKQSCSQKKKS